jgi:hypothetical protein
MANPEVVEKMKAFLTLHSPATEECHVVYVMVEVRKVIDQEKSRDTYPLLKFYADWTVHSRKDQVTKEMKEIVRQMFDAAAAEINSPLHGLVDRRRIRNFAYMKDLQSEIRAFLINHGIDDNLTPTKAIWVGFVQLLVKVLESQPIVEPIEEVPYVQFEPAAHGCVILRVMFTSPVRGHTHFDYMNAY